MTRTETLRGLMFTTTLAAGLLAATVAATAPKPAPDWKPQASERLVKLPATYLKKSIDLDFQDSGLGKALRAAEEAVGLKSQTLKDLQGAIAKADGEVKTELRHQFLAEKRKFLELVSRKNEFQKKQLQTRQKLFERMLARLKEKHVGASPARRKLMERQSAARARFESSLARVDMRVFEAASAPESKYTQRYTANMAAIEKLVARIQRHRMNSSVTTDGKPMTKAEYVRGMLSDTQARISILDQDETILGYMAKLVALDALALSEDAMDAEVADSDVPAVSGPSDSVTFFMTN